MAYRWVAGLWADRLVDLPLEDLQELWVVLPVVGLVEHLRFEDLTQCQ